MQPRGEPGSTKLLNGCQTIIYQSAPGFQAHFTVPAPGNSGMSLVLTVVAAKETFPVCKHTVGKGALEPLTETTRTQGLTWSRTVTILGLDLGFCYFSKKSPSPFLFFPFSHGGCYTHSLSIQASRETYISSATELSLAADLFLACLSRYFYFYLFISGCVGSTPGPYTR